MPREDEVEIPRFNFSSHFDAMWAFSGLINFVTSKNLQNNPDVSRLALQSLLAVGRGIEKLEEGLDEEFEQKREIFSRDVKRKIMSSNERFIKKMDSTEKLISTQNEQIENIKNELDELYAGNFSEVEIKDRLYSILTMNRELAEMGNNVKRNVAYAKEDKMLAAQDIENFLNNLRQRRL